MKMTIDDWIKHAREISLIERNNQKLNNTLGKSSPYYSQDCIKRAEEHEQLAEWLEELKAMRNLDKTNFSDGYNRGIDDFLKEADTTFPMQMQSDGTAVIRKLENIANRLKGGGSSE